MSKLNKKTIIAVILSVGLVAGVLMVKGVDTVNHNASVVETAPETVIEAPESRLDVPESADVTERATTTVEPVKTVQMTERSKTLVEPVEEEPVNQLSQEEIDALLETARSKFPSPSTTPPTTPNVQFMPISQD